MEGNKNEQHDFFSDLMFGRPYPIKKENEQHVQQSPKTKEDIQLEQIVSIIQAVGPTVEKLTPVISAIYSYFIDKQTSRNKKNKQEKNADD